jgi:hypothetical protein
VELTPADPADYTLARASVVLAVEPAPLSITAVDRTKPYGAPLPPLAATYAGFVNGEGPAVLTGTLSCGTTATATSPVGAYPITCSGLSSSSYAITWVAGTLSVVPAVTSTEVASSAITAIAGQAVTFTATVSAMAPGAGTPTGSVELLDGATSLGTVALTSGQATLSTAALAPGTHAITARYSGDGSFLPGGGALTQLVTYSACALYDQTKSVKSGATVPIKLYLCGGGGENLSSPSIALHATSVASVSGDTGDPQSPGDSNPDAGFVFDATLGGTGGYRFNLSTKGLASGTYRLEFVVGADPLTHALTFGVR